MERVTGIKFSEMADKVTGALDRIKKAISSAIDRIKEWNATSVKEKVFSIKERITRVISTITGGGEGGAYSGTSFFPGGLVMVGELGPELVALPRGSRVYNDQETKKILGDSKGITQHITINSPTPLTPVETARRIKTPPDSWPWNGRRGYDMTEIQLTNQQGESIILGNQALFPAKLGWGW